MNQFEETKRFYNKIAETTFDEWFNNTSLLKPLTEFVELLPVHPKVLDLGCGTGGESKKLVDLGADVTGIDFSEQSLEYAINNVPEAEFRNMNILEMDFQLEYFNGVMEAGVLFHFTEEEQISVIKDIWKILTIGGVFLSFPAVGESEGMQDINIENETYSRYARYMSLEKWIDLIMNQGFSKYKILDFNLMRFRSVLFFK